MRRCELCGDASRRTPIHRQPFLLPGSDEATSYEVVACQECGFVFADNIPPQRDQDAYYESSDRHVYDTGVPAGLATIHRSFHDFIVSTEGVVRDGGILDIGSSMGHFLDLFKQRGCERLQGIEPSSSARTLAAETYGIDVAATTLEQFSSERPFDLACMCGVLEHIVDLERTLQQVCALLTEDGCFFVAVPDAGRFASRPPREPFLEFALEHINFFTEASLTALMARHGMVPLRVASQFNTHYVNDYILAVYQRRPGPLPAIRPDVEGPKAVHRYVERCREKLDEVEQTIAELIASGEPVAVWGCGSLTSRLMACTALPSAHIVSFVDRSPNLQGKQVRGVPIEAPETLRGRDWTVLVASYVFGHEISQTLKDDFAYRGRVVTL